MKKALLLTAFCLIGFVSQALPFVTTPSPTTLPIHWYQLTVNGKYLVFNPEGSVFDMVVLKPTASTDDAYLWCFVKQSSGKIVIYNRAAKKYYSEGDYLTSDPNDSYINFVEEENDTEFYIGYYHKGDNKTYFLYEYIGDGSDILCGVGAKGSFADTFKVVEVLVEGNDNIGDVNGDEEIDVKDVTALITYILGTTPANFVLDNANINGEGEIDVQDVTALINLILK